MLVLERKVGQSIIINECIEVKILKRKGSSLESEIIRIGVQAPQNIKILRSELIKPNSKKYSSYQNDHYFQKR